MVPDKPQKVEKFHFTWCGHIGFRTRYYVKVRTFECPQTPAFFIIYMTLKVKLEILKFSNF